MTTKKMLSPGAYLMVSALTGTVMSKFTMGAGSRPDGSVAFDVPKGCLVIADPGLPVIIGRKVADIAEIPAEVKQEVADAIEASKAQKPAAAKPAKASEPELKLGGLEAPKSE